MLVTIATPTFNRAHLLPRLYKSLCNQNCKEFEWVVVDDGSEDETEQIVAGFINEGKITIRYIRKDNGGKHTAVNLAVKEAEGELFFIADSDDWLPESAIKKVIGAYVKIANENDFAGVCGLDEFADGRIVGSGLTRPIIDASPLDIRVKWNVRGDLKEVFKTAIIRMFPFPEIDGEKFCPEALVWNRIGLRYKLRYFNEPIYTVEYQLDGISNAITKARMKSPVASMMTYSEWFNHAKSTKLKLRMAVNYWRFSFCTKKRNISISKWAYLLYPIGLLMHMKDKKSFSL